MRSQGGPWDRVVSRTDEHGVAAGVPAVVGSAASVLCVGGDNVGGSAAMGLAEKKLYQVLGKNAFAVPAEKRCA